MKRKPKKWRIEKLLSEKLGWNSAQIWDWWQQSVPNMPANMTIEKVYKDEPRSVNKAALKMVAETLKEKLA